jgi:N-acetylneuraminic acid mutarotase
LWLFGGGGDGAQTGSGFFNDLWRFSTATGQWTWVSGSSMATPYGGGNLSGSYGTQGVAAAGNLPPARADGVAWRDSMGNLWLFSGAGNAMQAAAQSATGLNNDLWMYSPQTNLWTWVAGSNSTVPDGSFTAVYGTKGTAAAGNVPPAREGAATWNDAQGNLWLFGGQYAVVGTGTPFLNDLWEFSPSTKLWTWVGGSQITSSLTSTYGDEGTPAAANAPGIRSNSGAWTDATGRFWLFGGTTPGSNLDICCSVSNDLWSYDPITGLWTWVSGAMENGASATGSFGTLGAAGVGNAPPGRSSPVTFLDSSGNLWLYGGPDWSSNGLADLWEFNITPTTP